MTIVLAVIVTLLVVTILRNLIPASRGLDYRITAASSVDSAQFARDMGHLLGPPVVGGNRLTTLKNGAEIFPAMLDAIRRAQRSITFAADRAQSRQVTLEDWQRRPWPVKLREKLAGLLRTQL